MYDVENPKKAATAVPHPDGSVYKSHQRVGHEWDIVRESMYILMYAKHAVDLLQGTKYVTTSLFLPVAGRLAYIAHQDTCLKYEGQTVLILNEDVKQARQLMYTDCCTRFFNRLLDCKLEDFAVSTLLDPRYKSFKFKYSEKWMRGKFTEKQAQSWAANIYDNDWKPKAETDDAERAMVENASAQLSTPIKDG
ncbi:hypothetical protein CYMTET_12623 [Cymbomonas tetramitiformis]|uniref:Uncharacterized protein n=1 Tax=Cymbomonas tetramitiformis TaxID=36881 RepID=A0AAE0LBW0_9CHLO|nr:hypothetical protein CYMTET_12623 [Cymbomonas tetramitiformis]